MMTVFAVLPNPRRRPCETTACASSSHSIENATDTQQPPHPEALAQRAAKDAHPRYTALR
jgi:hypothetical protein